MGVFEVVRRAFRPAGTAADENYSMVLLEAHHHFLLKDRLREAAQRAFNHSFAPGHEDYAVVQSATTFVKAGEETIHITQSSSPMQGHAHEVETRSADHHFHHEAWQRHRGYLALDLWNRGHTRRDAYRVLAKLAAELMNDNVTGVFLPRDNEFYPNDGSAAEQLAHFKS